jgi:glycosyltransferase involved in cell wall biosynthesis
MLRACDGFIVNTEDETDFIHSRVPAARGITAVGPGVDPATFALRNGAKFRARYRLGQDPLVGFIGNIGTKKGAHTLLEAMSIVWKWNKDVRVVLVGYPAFNFAKIEQIYRDLPASERERVLLPSLPRTRRSICATRWMSLPPSTSESFGIAYLEAWLCRKPVIGARIGSTAYVIEDGVDGLLVKPEAPMIWPKRSGRCSATPRGGRRWASEAMRRPSAISHGSGLSRGSSVPVWTSSPPRTPGSDDVRSRRGPGTRNKRS